MKGDSNVFTIRICMYRTNSRQGEWETTLVVKSIRNVEYMTRSFESSRLSVFLPFPATNLEYVFTSHLGSAKQTTIYVNARKWLDRSRRSNNIYPYPPISCFLPFPRNFHVFFTITVDECLPTSCLPISILLYYLQYEIHNIFFWLIQG